jgi:hypothetical protein
MGWRSISPQSGAKRNTVPFGVSNLSHLKRAPENCEIAQENLEIAQENLEVDRKTVRLHRKTWRLTGKPGD